MNKIKIAMIGLNNAKNLGDPLICASTRYLLESAMKEQGIEGEVKVIDLLPDSLKKKKKQKKQGRNPLKAWLSKCKRLFQFAKELQIRQSDMQEAYLSYYRKELEGCSLIVFAGGGLIKYAQQENLNVSISGAIQAAKEKGIPAAFHACGVEGYDKGNPGCKRLEAAINDENVKIVTTRDDFKTLSECYKKREGLFIAKAADSAVFAGEILGVKKDEASRLIGIGVIRGDIFENYGTRLSESRLVEIYGEVLKKLKEKGREFKLFCNGYKPDYLFAEKVLEYAGLEEAYLLKRAESHEELVRQISGFQGVLAARLHACIISYSLEIPVVGLCWNDKLKYFGEETGHPERFLSPEDFSTENIVERVLKAIEEGYDKEAVKRYKEISKDSISRIVALLK